MKIEDCAKILVQELQKDSKTIEYIKMILRHVDGISYYRVSCGIQCCNKGECKCDWADEDREHWEDFEEAGSFSYSYAHYFGLEEDNELIPHIFNELINQEIITLDKDGEAEFASEILMQQMASQNKFPVKMFR